MPLSHRNQSLYHQVADHLRDRIRQGHYRPGAALATEVELARQFVMSVATVRRALAVLREEGLISTGRGEASTVRAHPERAGIPFGLGSRLICRMPSSLERAEFGIQAGVPLIEIHLATGEVNLVAADQVEVVDSR